MTIGKGRKGVKNRTVWSSDHHLQRQACEAPGDGPGQGASLKRKPEGLQRVLAHFANTPEALGAETQPRPPRGTSGFAARLLTAALGLEAKF